MVHYGIKIDRMTEQILDDKVLDEATGWFVRMRAEDISDVRAADFVHWISQSEAHQAAYAQIGGFWDSLPVPARPVKAHVTSLADYKARTENRTSGDRNWSPRLIAAAAAFLILSIVGFRYGDVLLMDGHATKVGELADIILEDGSHLMLNTNSEIHVDLKADKRIIYLDRGEVFFDVTRDENRPFYVETFGGLVRVLGTKFNIRQKGGMSDVTVLEGSVGVMDYGHVKDYVTPDVILTPDQKFTLGNDAVDNVAFPVDTAAVLSWRDRKLIYNGESFKTLVEDINRYYDGEIRIGDPVLNDIQVVAVLKIADRATMLKALETTFNVTARPVSKTLITLYPNKQ